MDLPARVSFSKGTHGPVSFYVRRFPIRSGASVALRCLIFRIKGILYRHSDLRSIVVSQHYLVGTLPVDVEHASPDFLEYSMISMLG